MRPRALGLLAVVALLLTGCADIRLETEDPPAATADAAEQHRQQLAVQSQQLADDAEHAAVTADADVADLLLAIAADARVQLDTLGGVWAPAGRHLVTVPRGDAAHVLDELTASAAQMRDDAIAADVGLAPLLAGISVSRSLRADQLATATGAEPGTLEPAWPSALDPSSAADLIRTVDAIGQAWEIRAARASLDDRDGWARRAENWRADAQELAALAGVADTDDDPRDVSYDLDTADLPATIADLRADLMGCWLAQVPTTEGEDRGAVIDLALTAARDAGMSDRDAADAEIPAIAGLDPSLD